MSSEVLELNFTKSISDLIKVNQVGLAIDEGLGEILTKVGFKSVGKKILTSVEKRAASASLKEATWAELRQEFSLWTAFSVLTKGASSIAKGIIQFFAT